MVHLHIGLDDTDSERGGCTTYITALLVEKLEKHVSFIEYPLLVRLNPNIPWKTRGNAALCLRVNIHHNLISHVKEEVVETVEKYADIGQPKTDPGIVFLEGNVPPQIETFSKMCMRTIVSKQEATKVIEKTNAEAFGYSGGRGIIGALASIGSLQEGDYTFELLAYRKPENCGTQRKVDFESILEMDEMTKGRTFNNVDTERRRILITPRGPDPVLLGIRGETPQDVKEAFHRIVLEEEIERWVVYRSNQGTDMHLLSDGGHLTIRPYNSITLQGTVSEKPHNSRGGHVFFDLSWEGEKLCCAAYEPAGSFRNVARNLIVGDRVRVSGGIRPREKGRSPTLNLEKLEVLSLAEQDTKSNPLCPNCAKRMESMGQNKGFRCKRCGLRELDGETNTFVLPRTIDLGIYLPPTRAQRHLTKPLSRYGLEKTEKPIMLEEFWGLKQQDIHT